MAKEIKKLMVKNVYGHLVTIVHESDYKKATGLHITTNHTGKMTGIHSLSTSPLLNQRCQERCKKDGYICKECFSISMQNKYSNLSKCTQENTHILTGGIIQYAPLILSRYFRFESFGDLNNDTQLINYFIIAKCNPDTKFALWTKNPDIVNHVINAGYDKPKNLNLVVSSFMLNQTFKNIWAWCDNIFTVWENEEQTTAAGKKITCGKRSCLTCGRCYKKHKESIYTDELLK